jgi:hypothetical protein
MSPVRMGQRLVGAVGLSTSMLLGCALPMTQGTSQVSVWARSHNRSDVHVYLLCGNRNARLLGIVHSQETAALDFPSTQTRCARGLNFFLVDRARNRGYWVGPMHPVPGDKINLVIEKYAGLSNVDLSGLGY